MGHEPGGRQATSATQAAPEGAAIDLYWLPLGAGQRVVRRSGRLYERLVAAVQRRPPQDLYHAALEVTAAAGRCVIELAPVPDDAGRDRGVVVEGPVGSRWLGRWRVFRYELRCWVGGALPDRAYAVDSPRRISGSGDEVERLLALLPDVPTHVWGRDEVHAGEMWNSNSVIAWLLARAGLVDTDPDTAGVRPDTAPGGAGGRPGTAPPDQGRAPGWEAGLVVAGVRSGRPRSRPSWTRVGESAASRRRSA